MEIMNDDTNPDFTNIKAGLADRPALTSEQFSRMAAINSRVRDLKQTGFDLREHLDLIKKEVLRIETKLEKTREELVEKTQEMTACFEDFVHKPFGITGQISISETEPHYITVIDEESVNS